MSDSAPENVEDDSRTCWVCFATREDDPEAPWVEPCRCRGTSRYVHQQCLQRWVDEKQKGNVNTKVSCPQCGQEYIIEFPKFGPVIYCLDAWERFLNKGSPLFIGGVILTSTYWSFLTYGALVVMEVMGGQEGLEYMEKHNDGGLLLLIGLPGIPISLMLLRMIHWEDYVLSVWRRVTPPVFKFLGWKEEGSSRIPANTNGSAYSDVRSVMRLVGGALTLPFIASRLGHWLWPDMDGVERTLMGGAIFFGVKGLCKLFYKQQQYQRQCRRQIRDFDENAVDQPATAPPSP